MEIVGEDKKIHRIIQKRERYFVERIGWISLCIGILYVCGYTWRVVYYKTLGIPLSIIDFPFQEILVPQPGLLAFIFGFAYIFLFMQYNEFCKRYRIAKITEMLGTELPTDQVFRYLIRRNVKSGRIFNRKTNAKVFSETVLRYIKDCSKGESKKPFDVDGFKNELIKLFPDATEKIRQSVFSYYSGLSSMSKEEAIQIVRFSSGIPLKGSMVFYWLTFLPGILIPVHLLYYGSILMFSWMLGVVAGLFLSFTSHSKDRFQMWFMIAFSIVFAIIGTGISAKWIGNLDLIEARFPVAKVLLVDKKVESGLLLGRFSDRYVIMPLDTPDLEKRINIQMGQVISMNLISPNWKVNNIYKLEERDKIQKLLKDMEDSKVK